MDWTTYQRRRARQGLAWATLRVAALLLLVAAAVTACWPRDAAAQSISIPARSAIYRVQLERTAAMQFGLNAPVARLAAQIHQESAWNPRAASAYAQGLTQFTPATARWIPGICPEVGPMDVWDPGWSLRAQSCYMAFLVKRIPTYRYAGPMSTCTRWAYALRAYNGGEGWLNKERLAAQRAGADANDWRAVERYRVRAGWAHKENTDYPRRILLTLEPAYLRAGWPGKADCR